MAVQPLLNPRFDGRVIRRREARDWGLTPHDLDRLVRSGAVVYLVRGLYADAAAADDLLLRGQAVAMALPRGAAVCRRTAAWLRG